MPISRSAGAARLSTATLATAHADVARPAYDRARVTPGIVHLGIGAFHRAHQAVTIDDCLAAGETGWGIVGASLRSAATADALGPQDGLYTLVLRDGDADRLRIIGSILNVIVASAAPERLLDILADPRIRIVTLTITEKGYMVDVATGALRLDHPDIIHDLGHPNRPRTALGFLTEAIHRRRAAGTAPFTILSCDNLPHNGRMLRRALIDFAIRRDPDLGAFVATTVSCPSSMVDRIVPATTDADRTAVADRLGLDDAWPVLGEPFTQWVIEDRFPHGRPPLDRFGVAFVDDIEPFEQMKLRLLNGAHSALAAMGRLAGLRTVAEAIRAPAIRRVIAAYWSEVIPTLVIPATEALAYTERLLVRFGNVALQHQTAQIAGDASQKLPQRILAPLRARIAAGAATGALIFAVAAWIRSCGGRDDQGNALPLNDPVFQAWTGQPDQRTTAPAEVIGAYLGLTAVFGPDLSRDMRFAADLADALAAIANLGVIAAIDRRFPPDDDPLR